MVMDNKHLSFLHEDGFWLTLHALLYDALVLSLLAFAGLMTIEGLMPGFVSAHLNLAKVLFSIALLFFACISIGQQSAVAKAMMNRRKNISASSGNVSKWLIGFLLLWSSLLILNSLIKFPLWAIASIFLFTALIGKLLYKEFFEIK